MTSISCYNIEKLNFNKEVEAIELLKKKFQLEKQETEVNNDGHVYFLALQLKSLRKIEDLKKYTLKIIKSLILINLKLIN